MLSALAYSQPHQIRKFLPFLWYFTLIALFISWFFLYIIPMLSALAHSLQKAPYKFTSIDQSTHWILNNHLTDCNKINSAEKVHDSIKTKHLSTSNKNSYILVSEYSDAQPKSSNCHCQGQLSSGSHALRCPQPRKVSMHRGQQNNLLRHAHVNKLRSCMTKMQWLCPTCKFLSSNPNYYKHKRILFL